MASEAQEKPHEHQRLCSHRADNSGLSGETGGALPQKLAEERFCLCQHQRRTHLFGVQGKPHEAVEVEDPQYVISKVTELIQTRIQPEPRFALEIFKENGMLCVDLRVFDGSAYTCYYTADGVNDSSIQCEADMEKRALPE